MPYTADTSLPTIRHGGFARLPHRGAEGELRHPEGAPAAPRARRASGDSRAYRMHRLLALADALAIVIAMGLCILIADLTDFRTAPPLGGVLAPLFLAAWIGLAGIAGLYHVDDRRIDCSISDEIFRIVQLVAVWVWLVFLGFAIVSTDSPRVAPAVSLGVIAVPVLLLMRVLARRLARTQSWYRQTAVIVGTESDCWRIQRTLSRHPEYGVEVVRTVLPHEARNGIGNGNGPRPRRDPHGGGRRSLISVVERGQADRVIIASHHEGIDERTGLLRVLARRGVHVDLVPGDADVFRSDAELHHIEGVPLLTLPTTDRPRSAAAVKRAIDIVLSASALIVLSPLLLASAIAIKLDSKGSVFFRQQRAGRRSAPFMMLKLRTMVADAEDLKDRLRELTEDREGLFKIPDDPRITRVGRVLRKTSLDELPQLINVLKGDMSLVGPRPLPVDEDRRISERYRARNDVRPGITGPWQVLGRSDIPFADMVKLDYTYVVNWSIADDVKLMLRTISAVSGGKGAY